MQLTILDPTVSTSMNVFLIIANIINLIYNIPQMLRTYKTKSTKDFSTWFIFLRIVGNSIWLVYAINIDNLQILINNIVTVIASLFIGYYKFLELYYREKDYELIKYNEIKYNEIKYNEIKYNEIADNKLLELELEQNENTDSKLLKIVTI